MAAMGAVRLWVSLVINIDEGAPGAPLGALGFITSQQCCSRYFTSWVAWSVDALDFFSVSLSVDALQVQFNQSTKNIVSTFCHRRG